MPPRCALAEAWSDGRIKMFVTAAGLRLRRERPALFLEGNYQPLEVARETSADVIAFSREHDGQEVPVAAPRFVGAYVAEHRQLPLGEHAWARGRLLLRRDRGSQPLRECIDRRDAPGRSRGWAL